ncbi:MAG: hypothetical protein CL386_09305 [Acidiferrobacter sp.]|nr:hypothetical protein [Acidiferrobacter sp.]
MRNRIIHTTPTEDLFGTQSIPDKIYTGQLWIILIKGNFRSPSMSHHAAATLADHVSSVSSIAQ